VQTIQDAVRARNVILVVGTGVSASMAPRSKTATWVALIQDGIDLAVRLDPDLSGQWKNLVDGLLDYGKSAETAEQLTAAASMVKASLVKHGPLAFAHWLENAVGGIECEEPALALAIGELAFPILTTNYDTLLESALERSHATWQQIGEMQKIVAGITNGIGHMHGAWNAPESVIFTTEDYQGVLRSPGAQALQQAISSFKSIIYIGFGGGLTDPNFGKLLEWHRETFPESSVTHFRLCRDDELEPLERAHAGSNILPVSYGASFSDLPPFLSGLAEIVGSTNRTPAGIARDVVQEARQAVIDLLSEDLILGDVNSSRDLDELLFPPRLLPVPNADYVKDRSSGGEIQKIDAASELNEVEFIVLAAESETGLTTTLRWLAWKSSVDLVSAAPVCVSFRECGAGPNPLEKRVRSVARELGLIGREATELPEYVLAIDDVNPGVPNVFERVMSAVSNGGPVVTYIGCRQGDEDAVMERLRLAGHRPRLRYLSRLGDQDVAQLVARAHPAADDVLASSVIGVLRGENLPRTPFSVSLLIQVLMQGGTVASSASQTSILEQYVAMLLGRGDPHEDARFTIDQPGREALLSNYAEHLARCGTAGVEEAAAGVFFDKVMKGYDWPDSAPAIIRHLIELKVLRRNGKSIEFGRSSFLFLFAAKRAATSETFREFLLHDALYYAPVLQDYAALVRSDSAVLSRVLETLPTPGELNTNRSPYEMLERVAAPPVLAEPTVDDEVDEGDVPGGNGALEPELVFGLDDHNDDDRPPFPVDATENLTLARRLMRSLDLTSRVLRDSDQIEDLDLKSEAFLVILRRWGDLVSVIHDDDQFSDVITEVLRSSDIGQSLVAQDARLFDEFAGAMIRIFPAAIAGGGIEATLASRKLLRVFERALEAGDLSRDDEGALAACLFAFALEEPGWASAIRRILAKRGNFWLARNFLLPLLREYYAVVDRFTPASDEKEIIELCVEIFERATRYESTALRTARLDAFRTEMRRDRQLTRARERAAGTGLSPTQ